MRSLALKRPVSCKKRRILFARYVWVLLSDESRFCVFVLAGKVAGIFGSLRGTGGVKRLSVVQRSNGRCT
eukprot:6214352-Pleurochrysis_carterae.AAC.2